MGLTPFRPRGTITHQLTDTLVSEMMSSSPPRRQIASGKASLSSNDGMVWRHTHQLWSHQSPMDDRLPYQCPCDALSASARAGPASPLPSLSLHRSTLDKPAQYVTARPLSTCDAPTPQLNVARDDFHRGIDHHNPSTCAVGA